MVILMYYTYVVCVNVQTEMRFEIEQLLFTTPTLWKQELYIFIQKDPFANVVSKMAAILPRP